MASKRRRSDNGTDKESQGESQTDSQIKRESQSQTQNSANENDSGGRGDKELVAAPQLDLPASVKEQIVLQLESAPETQTRLVQASRAWAAAGVAVRWRHVTPAFLVSEKPESACEAAASRLARLVRLARHARRLTASAAPADADADALALLGPFLLFAALSDLVHLVVLFPAFPASTSMTAPPASQMNASQQLASSPASSPVISTVPLSQHHHQQLKPYHFSDSQIDSPTSATAAAAAKATRLVSLLEAAAKFAPASLSKLSIRGGKSCSESIVRDLLIAFPNITTLKLTCPAVAGMIPR
ncbi:hypothetical protein HK100_004705, partial [Physocladia obscura]